MSHYQEFDAQNQPESRVNDGYGSKYGKHGLTPFEDAAASYQGAMYDLDDLIRVLAHYMRGNGSLYEVVEYLEKNYRKQWDKYMGNEDKAAPTDDPIEWVIGDIYSYLLTNGFTSSGVLKISNGEEVVFADRNDGKYYVVHKSAIIKKHTPKPVEHTYSMEEIIVEYDNTLKSCESWELRGKIIRQLLKELGENV